MAFALLDDLNFASHSLLRMPSNWGVYFGIPLGFGGIEIDLFGKQAVVPDSHLSDRERAARIAVSIFMDANEQFEAQQGGLSWLPIFGGRLRSSFFSEEDLTSDIIGFYIASQRFSGSGSSEQIKQQIRGMCEAVGPEKSSRVFRENYAGGAMAVTKWAHWFPRFLPLTGCDTCNEPRTWPSEFATLTSSRAFPQANGLWWWYRGIFEDGPPIGTERPSVVVFADPAYLRPPTPPPPDPTPPNGTPVPGGTPVP